MISRRARPAGAAASVTLAALATKEQP